MRARSGVSEAPDERVEVRKCGPNDDSVGSMNKRISGLRGGGYTSFADGEGTESGYGLDQFQRRKRRTAGLAGIAAQRGRKHVCAGSQRCSRVLDPRAVCKRALSLRTTDSAFDLISSFSRFSSARFSRSSAVRS